MQRKSLKSIKTKTNQKLYGYDPADALDTPEAAALFIADAFETGDPAYIANALGVIARAKGVAKIADETGLSREQLYRSFSESGNPTLKTLLIFMQAIGVSMTTKTPRTLSKMRRLG
ncbi:MAG TPA: addiction module antidote protein [Coxiellaceae bacterium]|nr:addiction module antidote protein [Coxiellaceae bacterium]